MNFHHFKGFIQGLRDTQRIDKDLSDLGVDINGLIGHFNKWTIPLSKLAFNEAQNDLINWWLFDAPHGLMGNPTECHMWEKDGTPIDLSDEWKLFVYLQTLKT